MTNQTTPAELMAGFAKDLLGINVEASIRCGKTTSDSLRGFYALAGNAAWAAYQLLVTLHETAPAVLAELLPHLVEELNDGEYLADADEVAEALGVDVRALADRVDAECENAEVAR